jgi:hypothetical protein
MKYIFFIGLSLFSFACFAQDSTSVPQTPPENLTINKDIRLTKLAKKEAEINDANGVLRGPKYIRGYRLMLLSTNNQAAAMNLRTQLLKKYPEQKVYMSYQPPYIKVKFGNFLEKSDADNMKKELEKTKIVANNIYIVSELIENNFDKNKDGSTPASN